VRFLPLQVQKNTPRACPPACRFQVLAPACEIGAAKRFPTGPSTVSSTGNADAAVLFSCQPGGAFVTVSLLLPGNRGRAELALGIDGPGLTGHAPGRHGYRGSGLAGLTGPRLWRDRADRRQVGGAAHHRPCFQGGWRNWPVTLRRGRVRVWRGFGLVRTGRTQGLRAGVRLSATGPVPAVGKPGMVGFRAGVAGCGTPRGSRMFRAG
jgi:hypothetical protein